MTKRQERLAAHFAALGHPVRWAVVQQLAEAGSSGRVVQQVQAVLRIPGSTLSHHLDALHREGLVRQVREGRFLRYRVAPGALHAVAKALLGVARAAESEAPGEVETPGSVAPPSAGDEGVPSLVAEPKPVASDPAVPVPDDAIPAKRQPVDDREGPDAYGDAPDWRAW